MMSSGTFEGRILINGIQDADSVRVHLNDYEIGITDPAKPMFARKILTLHPFSPKMFSQVSDAGTLREGIYYAMKGANLGTCTEGLLGHARAAGVRELVVTGFTLRARYTPAGLAIEIDGKMEAGRRYAGLKPVVPGTFHVEFRVPRAELSDFLQMDPEDWKYLEACLKQLPGGMLHLAFDAAHHTSKATRVLS